MNILYPPSRSYNWHFIIRITYLSFYPSDCHFYAFQIWKMLYYFFNITNIFEYTEKVKEFYSEQPPRIFNYIFVYLLYTIISSNPLLTINLFILIVWIICCNSQFPSTKGELLKFLCIQNRYLTFISFSSRNVWLYMLWIFFIFLFFSINYKATNSWEPTCFSYEEKNTEILSWAMTQIEKNNPQKN